MARSLPWRLRRPPKQRASCWTTCASWPSPTNRSGTLPPRRPCVSLKPNWRISPKRCVSRFDSIPSWSMAMTMESREYRGNSSNSSAIGSDPFWLLLTAILILALVLVGLPAIIASFFAQRYTYRHLARFGWRWSAAIWIVLGVLAIPLLYSLMQHGLEQMMQRGVGDYVRSGQH